jgi:hypothetical protein
MSFFSKNYTSAYLDMVDRWEWVFEAQTYERSTDMWKVYMNGQYHSNATNNQGESLLAAISRVFQI